MNNNYLQTTPNNDHTTSYRLVSTSQQQPQTQIQSNSHPLTNPTPTEKIFHPLIQYRLTPSFCPKSHNIISPLIGTSSIPLSLSTVFSEFQTAIHLNINNSLLPTRERILDVCSTEHPNQNMVVKVEKLLVQWDVGLEEGEVVLEGIANVVQLSVALNGMRKREWRDVFVAFVGFVEAGDGEEGDRGVICV